MPILALMLANNSPTESASSSSWFALLLPRSFLFYSFLRCSSEILLASFCNSFILSNFYVVFEFINLSILRYLSSLY